MGPFRVDGLPADLSQTTSNLTFDQDTGIIRYTPSGSPPTSQQMLSNMKQVRLALQQAALDGKTTGDRTIGWPTDVQLKSKAEVKKMLVPSYISVGDYDRMQFDKISIGNVSEKDPADTILFEYQPANGGTKLIMLKSGDGQILKAGQSLGNSPPRSPAFLE